MVDRRERLLGVAVPHGRLRLGERSEGFLDRGRAMFDRPPLLKERRHLSKEAAEQLQRSLQTEGWRKTDPPWGAAAEEP